MDPSYLLKNSEMVSAFDMECFLLLCLHMATDAVKDSPQNMQCLAEKED
jgi:hypothetical protein